MLSKIKLFLQTKKGKASIVAAVSAGILYIFPDSAEAVANIADFLAEILGGVADNVQPENNE